LLVDQGSGQIYWFPNRAQKMTGFDQQANEEERSERKKRRKEKTDGALLRSRD
jgi:hypothetical protein